MAVYTPWDVAYLEVPNTVKWNLLGGNDEFFNDNVVPLGIVVAWSGTLANIPIGWALCDGNGGRPDYRDRFILGAPASTEAGVAGGAHSISLSSSQLISHIHSASFSNVAAHIHTGSTNIDGNHTHSGTTTTSGSHAHTIRRNGGYGSYFRLLGGTYGDMGYVSGLTANASHPNHTATPSSSAHSHGAGNSSTASNHTHSITINSAGTGAAIDNRPAFATVAFIIKIEVGSEFPYESWAVLEDDTPDEQKFNILGKNDVYFNNGVLSTGLIAFWSGLLANIPSGWALCDGLSGRPDYRDKFLMGAVAGQNPGPTGGVHSFIMTLAQLPPHTHTASISSAGSHLHSISASSASHTHRATITAHGSHAHNVLFQYFGGGSSGMVNSVGSGETWESGHISSAGGHGHTVNMSNTAHDHDYTTGSVANHTHTGLSVGNAGGGGTAEQRTIDNRPAFYKLAIIIKTTPSDTYTPWSVEALEKPVTEKWQILGDNDEYLYSLIPKSGLIFIWSGLLGDIPAGYALCNGVGGRPDLRNKFILGTAAAEQPGGTGGAHSYVLTAYQMAQHNHGGSVGSAGGHSHTGSVASGTHDHPVSINTVGSHSHLASVWDFGSGLQTMITYEELVVDYWSSWVASAGSHSHGVTLWNSAPSAAHSHALSVGSAGGHGHTVTVNAIGSGASIDNRPKYRTVQFIMKT